MTPIRVRVTIDETIKMHVEDAETGKPIDFTVLHHSFEAVQGGHMHAHYDLRVAEKPDALVLDVPDWMTVSVTYYTPDLAEWMGP